MSGGRGRQCWFTHGLTRVTGLVCYMQMSNIDVFEWEMSVFCRFLSLSLLIDPYIVGDLLSTTMAGWTEEGD